MKHIVIIGAGFGGIACARSLLQLNAHCSITLVNRTPYHSIHGNVYEVATAPGDLSESIELKRTVEIPLAQIFAGTSINIAVGEVTHINTESRVVSVAGQSLSYDYVVMAQGAVPGFFNIPGAAKYALPMQTGAHALRIRNTLEQAIVAHRYDARQPHLNIVIAGGGIAGVEIAAELQGFIRFTAWENGLDPAKIHTVVVERAPVLLPGFDERVSNAVSRRLSQLGVRISCNSAIAEITDRELHMVDTSTLKYDVLIWTAGVTAAPLIPGLQLECTKGDRVVVDEQFRASDKKIFVIGDQCCHLDPAGVPLPGTAAQAMDHGKYIGRALAALVKNQSPPHHACKTYPLLAPLGGKWGMYYSKRFFFTGYFAYLVRELVWAHYFITLLGLRRGLQWALRSDTLYARND